MTRLKGKALPALTPYVAALDAPPLKEGAAGLVPLTLLAGAILTFSHYFATARGFALLPFSSSLPGDRSIWVFLYWLGCLLAGWVALPAWFSARRLGLWPGDLGARIGDAPSCWKAYLAIYALNLPLVWWASGSTAFLSYYPFYRGAGDSLAAFVLWEAVYGLQFVCVEFFFRGFLLHGARSALGGWAAVAFTALPYCMLHFPKPFPEPLLALAMGMALGVMSLRTGSIWGGVAVHVSVAVTMDVLALSARPGSIFYSG